MIRRLIKVFFWVLPMVFLTIGCADDLRNQYIGNVGEEVSISYTVDKVSLTRDGSSLEWESAIDHAYLLFYDSSNEEDGDLPVTFVRAEIKEDSPGALTFKMPLILEENKGYRLVAVANADDYVPDGFSSFGSYLSAWCGNESDVRDRAFHLFKEDVLTSALDFLPMVGSPEQGGKFSFTKENGAYQVSTSLKFRRSVSRVDLVNLIKDGFSVEGVALCNWRDSFGIESSEYPVGTIHNEISEFLLAIVSDESGIQKMMGQLYCFPSVSENAAINDTISTALIIKAKYGDDADPSYYRVNVGMSGSRVEVKANTKYSVTIQSVKGRGAATPEEAYASDENLLVLSMVDDWDFEENFTMDDYGNFIILSRRSLEFAADSQEIVEIKVLSSTGLNWNVEYIADGEDSTDAFSVSKVSDRSIYVSPAGSNSGSVTLSGKCRVSAITSQGNTLTLDVILRQHPLGDAPYTPDIPWDKDYALVPLQGDGVKVDHEKMTIEIDGFDPNCFNSFIDIPFLVYINESKKDKETIVYNELEWPLEGRISKETSSDFVYCCNSFKDKSVFSKSKNQEISKNGLSLSSLNVKNNDTIFISVGAMGPDDPEIIKDLQIGVFPNSLKYSLSIKPKTSIIDDVILNDKNGVSWVIFDRNVQDLQVLGSSWIGRDSNLGGIKRQAYNYTTFGNYTIQIPFKKKTADTPLEEWEHKLYEGVSLSYENKNKLNANEFGVINKWLAKYQYFDWQDRTSPFYEKDNLSEWKLIDEYMLKICVEKMHVSKMRMFLVSEVPAKSGKSTIPICCYWPYRGLLMGDESIFTYGYYYADPEGNPTSIQLIYCDKTSIKTFLPTSPSGFYGFSRLIRPLTKDELQVYKTNYLGYGSQPHKLTICHPDTYTSEDLGWISY